ncbi:Crp/Fnr family transcriptional regulator [Acetivibrio sp.]|uniref:Crp/Fnr family transcriptional regulator n=1 Tax=Acetivibrio sp. TaxID=1872092 RepID=UPI0032C23CA3
MAKTFYFDEMLPFWNELDNLEKEMIKQGSIETKYKKGSLLHSSEQGCKGIMLLLSGGLRTYIVSDEGREVTLFRVNKGEACVLSGSCLMDSIAFDVMIEAVEDTEVIIIPSSVLSQIMEKHPRVEVLLPIIIAVFGGNKWFCNNMCGRGQLLSKLGGLLKFFKNKQAPRWLTSKWFRYGFLGFFLPMFFNMIFQTYLVAAKARTLTQAIKLFWTFKVPWGWTYTAGIVPDWIAQFSFGFYSLMLTSMLLGLIVMVFYKPRTWCTFCPMGTMTQSICKLKHKSNLNSNFK